MTEREAVIYGHQKFLFRALSKLVIFIKKISF